MSDHKPVTLSDHSPTPDGEGEMSDNFPVLAQPIAGPGNGSNPHEEIKGKSLSENNTLSLEQFLKIYSEVNEEVDSQR